MDKISSKSWFLICVVVILWAVAFVNLDSFIYSDKAASGSISDTSTLGQTLPYNEELSTILSQVRVSASAATQLNIPAGDFNVREWRYWSDPTWHAIVLEILKTYGAMEVLDPDPDVSGRTDLPRPSDKFVFSIFEKYNYTAAGLYAIVRDGYDNILDISIPFNNDKPDCSKIVLKLNDVLLSLRTKAFTTGVMTCDFPVLVPVNDPPHISPPLTSKSVKVGDTLSFDVLAVDANGDPIKYSASQIPSRASFNATTKKFTWTPIVGQVGTYYVSFTVRDSNESRLLTTTVIQIKVVK